MLWVLIRSTLQRCFRYFVKIIYVVGTHKKHLAEVRLIFHDDNICCGYSLEAPCRGASDIS